MQSEQPRRVSKPPRPEQALPTTPPPEQLLPTLPPPQGAAVMLRLEKGIQDAVEAMSEVGLNQRESIEEAVTHLERRYFAKLNDT